MAKTKTDKLDTCEEEQTYAAAAVAESKDEFSNAPPACPVTGKETDIGELTLLDSLIPKTKTRPRRSLSHAKILIYGCPKIGKSTLASRFPGAWFWITEEGTDWLSIYEPLRITNWEQFLDYCAAVDSGPPKTFGDGKPILTLVIDTTDLLFKMCDDSMKTQLGVSNMGDLDWGKGWAALGDEFERVMSKISRWPYGLIFISHMKEREIKSKATKIDRIEPAMRATGLRIIQNLCDLILYCYADETPVLDEEGTPTGVIKEERKIRCQPCNNIVAGDRTSFLPESIELSYDKLVSYFPDTIEEK